MSGTPNYFLPGEYIGDMHYGLGHIANKVEGRRGSPAACRQTQFEIQSVEQAAALQDFLEATRSLFHDDGYLNKMVVAVDDYSGCYMYDGRYFGVITF